MDFLATNGAREVAICVLSGMVILGVAWDWFKSR